MSSDADHRVVVIGSGPAGAAAAVFLRRAGAEVLVLEAGSQHAAPGVTARVLGLTVFKHRKPLVKRAGVASTGDPRAGVFQELAPGGLSNHWSCAVPRFAPEDFADAARAGEAYAWPIAYDDVAPWYDRVEPLLKIAGEAEGSLQFPSGKVRRPRRLGSDWASLVREAREEGRTLAPMPYAYGGESTVTLSGTVFNAFVRLIRPELRSGRMAIRYDALVLRLEWSPSGRRVEAVVFRDRRTGTENRVPCRAVVLAAGAVGTPEILVASSNAEFPMGLGNTHGVLGHYLHDHPLAKVVVDLRTPISVYPPAYLTRQTLDRAPPLYAAACMQWSGSEMLARSALKGKPGRLSWIGFSVFGTMAPIPDNWIRPDPSRPQADGRPGLTLHINLPPEAITALERARDDLVGILTRAGLEPRVRLWDVAAPCESVHYGGTCRMHASPRFGMLDPRGRLHAVPNVAVADSSAFTTGPEKNPVLTAMALSARASHHLAEELRGGDI